jgi:peptidoglycan/LPS O-acetylase OafA/YrhL
VTTDHHGATPGAAALPGADAPHVAALDGLRGLAILLVLFVHFVGDELPRGAAERAAVKMANYGIWGVDLFFVLSGFLITGILLDKRSSAHYYRDFYARRTLRIFPLYFATLFFLFVVLPRLPIHYPTGLAESADHQAWLWTYGCNFYLARAGGWALPYVSHFWSLAVEEHFYLVWPFLVHALSRRALVAASATGVALALGLRLFLARSGASDVALVVLTPCRIDAFCVGALLAVAVRDVGVAAVGKLGARSLAPFAGAVIVVSAVHAATAGSLGTVLLPVRGTLIACLCGALIVWCLVAARNTRMGRFVGSRAMRALGKYSYGLYVVHGVVAYAMQVRGVTAIIAARVGSHSLAIALQALLGAGASLVLAVLSYELMEKHFLQLKDRIAPRSAPCKVPVRS